MAFTWLTGFTVDGNVGIGTASPTVKLDVIGAGLFTENVTSNTRFEINSVGVGIIGAISNTANDLNIFSTTTGHNGLRFHTTGILPTNNAGVIIDADANLGEANYRFKDGYFSGTITAADFIGASGAYLPLAGGTMTGNINFNDDVYARFGNGNDLDIGHDASNSYITHSGVGNLIIQNTEDDAEIIFKSDDGSGGVATYFFLDPASDATQFTKTVYLQDNVKAQFGNSSDLKIYHSGSDSFINDTGAGDLKISGSSILMLKPGLGEFLARFIPDGAVELYHDGSKKLETTSTGINITGGWVTNGVSVATANVEHTDNTKSLFGNGNDLQIYHDGSHSYIQDTSGTGDLRIDTNLFRLRSANGGETMIRAFEDGAVILSHNNFDKLTTTSTGISVTGDIDLSASNADILMIDNGGAALEIKQGSDLYMRFVTTNGGEKIQVNKNIELQGLTATSGTFSSTVTAPTFSGDLNGTINTATTAVTQANAIDNTTVATTAYVVNKIAELPAGLNFLGTWNADTNTPTLASGGGERSEGTTTTLTANKLIDSSATFTTAPAVVVGDRVRVVTPNGPEFALVTAVDSATELTLAADIVTATGEAYILEVAPFIPEGSYYIVSTNGAEDLNGITDWKVGDWVVASSTNVWQKIDNSSVLDGSGTGGSVTGWAGSGTSNTLTDAPITFSGNNTTFAANVTTGGTIFVNNVASDKKIAFRRTGANNFSIEHDVSSLYFYNESTSTSCFKIANNSNATFAGNVALTSGSLSITGDGSNAATLTESSVGIFTIAALDDIILDAAGDIALDAGGDDIRFRVNGTTYGSFNNASSNLNIYSSIQDKSIKFLGNDGGTEITALTLNMADGGDATFAGKATSSSTVSADAATTLVTKDYVDSSAGNPSHFRQGHKNHNLTNAFTTCLTVNLNNHTGCYVTICVFGDWGSHSSAAYRGEFFLQNGANAYNEPGIILRQDDNTSVGTDQIVCQIVDPTSTANPKDFNIQIRTTATSGTTGFTGLLTFTVQGKFNSVT